MQANTWKHLSWAAQCAGLCLSLALGGCASHAESSHHEETGEYPVTRPLRMDTEYTTEYVAQIHAVQHIEVRALERGYLQETFVDEGQSIHAGDRMFQIMPLIYQAELQKAKAEAEFAGIEYKNTESLRAGNVVSPNQLLLAKARLDKAKAEQSLAEAHLQLTQVKAPFDGLMGLLEVRNGSLIEEGELLTTLADNHEMWVYFNVNESQYIDYKCRVNQDDAMNVKLRLANGEIFDHDGVVSAIEGDFDNETGNIAFRATFANPERLLRHGETGNVIVSTPLHDVLLIPQMATFDVLDKKFVFVIGEDHVARRREITVSHELPHLYVVDSGLTEEDQVLLEGIRKVRDGREVETRFEEPAEVMAHLEVHAE